MCPSVTANGRGNADAVLISQLAVGHTYADAADTAGVSERTARRRMNEPTFRSHVEAAQADMLSCALGRAAVAASEAVETLLRLMQSAESESVQVRAASTLLEFVSRRSPARAIDVLRSGTMVPGAAFEEFVRFLMVTASAHVPGENMDSFLDDLRVAFKDFRISS